MGKAVAQVRGGLHANYGPTLTQMAAWNSIYDHRFTAQSLAHKGDFEARALLNQLIGAAAGGTAIALYGEIQPSTELGGARPVANATIINRATTAADVSDLKNELGALSANTFVGSPVYNGDRNPLGTR